jgi:carbon monoxide dehydrogenase subunit G
MKNTVLIAAPLEDVWTAIRDVPSITPCIPGAEFDKDLGDGRYAGSVQVKLGPMALVLEGELNFAAVDPVKKTISLRAAGRDRHGLGHVDAMISMAAKPVDHETSLDITTDLRLGGPVSQFGRQAIVSDIATSLLKRFGDCLATRVGAEGKARAKSGE